MGGVIVVSRTATGSLVDFESGRNRKINLVPTKKLGPASSGRRGKLLAPVPTGRTLPWESHARSLTEIFQGRTNSSTRCAILQSVGKQATSNREQEVVPCFLHSVADEEATLSSPFLRQRGLTCVLRSYLIMTRESYTVSLQSKQYHRQPDRSYPLSATNQAFRYDASAVPRLRAATLKA